MNTKITLCLMLITQVASAGLLADYNFENNLSGSSAGAPDMVYLGDSEAYVDGIVDGFDVKALQVDLQTGLRLEMSQWDICDAYSIVIHGVMENTFSYKKIIDFRGISSDAGLYSNDGFIYYVLGFNAPTESVFENEYFQLVMTRDVDEVVNVYVNGVNQLSFTDTSSASGMCFSDEFYFFRDDLVTNTENPSGAVARITLYDHALTVDEIGALEILDIIFADDFNPELP